jgi:hypothetical protein
MNQLSWGFAFHFSNIGLGNLGTAQDFGSGRAPDVENGSSRCMVFSVQIL